MQVTRGWGKVGGELLYNKYRLFTGNYENLLDINSGEGYSDLWMYLMPLNSTLTNSKNMMLCIFDHNNERKNMTKLNNLDE